MRSTEKKERPNAIEKAMEILTTFADHDRDMGTCEISELTGFHKATTSRILAVLMDYGLLNQVDETRKYRVGPLAYKLGASNSSQSIHAFVELAKVHIDKLRDKINESIVLEAWTGSRAIACYMAESKSPLRVSMPPADILPNHAPAGAKAILSFINRDQVDGLLGEKFEVFTDNTITTKAELQRRLVEFNKQGYAVDNEELYPGIYALGVPIFNCIGKPVAAITAVMPATRVSDSVEAETVAALKRIAKIIAKDIKTPTGWAFPAQ